MTALPVVVRWTHERKKEVVALVAAGFSTRDAVCAHYAISPDEFTLWQREFRRSNTPAILNAVEAALSEKDGRTPRQVALRIDDLAKTTIRHALAQLVADGRATFEGPDTRRLYRRADPKLAQARRVHALAVAQEDHDLTTQETSP